MSWLLTDVRALHGTRYFELLPGRYSGKCWSAESVFLSEEVFAHIEPIFEKLCPNYDHYAFTDIARSHWTPILADLSRMQTFLTAEPAPAEALGQIGFLTANGKDVFAKDFRANVSQLRSTIADLIQWIRITLDTHEAIALLGL